MKTKVQEILRIARMNTNYDFAATEISGCIDGKTFNGLMLSRKGEEHYKAGTEYIGSVRLWDDGSFEFTGDRRATQVLAEENEEIIHAFMKAHEFLNSL